jgi:hypothetical protein
MVTNESGSLAADHRRVLVDMAQGFFRGKVLCGAVRLGLADALGDERRTLDELAAATGSKPETLRRLLRALASIGVVEQINGESFELTQLGQPLRREVDGSVWASVVFWADLLDDAWTYLADCVRAGGRHGAVDALQREGAKSRWDGVADAPTIFHHVFARASAEDMAPYARAYPFSSCRVVADLGGGGGGLLRAILRENPHVRGVLVDRQEAVDGAAPLFSAAGMAERCELISGDLLEGVPPGADTYVLKAVLHVYDDVGAGRILNNCRGVMTDTDRVVIIETLLPERIESGDASVERAVMSDINMLVVTGGKERDLAEWDHLLSTGGFRMGEVTMVTGEWRHALIEAIPD